MKAAVFSKSQNTANNFVNENYATRYVVLLTLSLT